MTIPDQIKFAISITGGTFAMGLGYFLFIRKRKPQTDITVSEEEPWPS